MVMWMSRTERKKAQKKEKSYLKLCIFITILLLISGLIAVDYQIRAMLAIDEATLIGYERLENNQYIIYLMGDSHLIDVTILAAQIDNKFAEFKEIAYNIKSNLVETLNRIVSQ